MQTRGSLICIDSNLKRLQWRKEILSEVEDQQPVRWHAEEGVDLQEINMGLGLIANRQLTIIRCETLDHYLKITKIKADIKTDPWELMGQMWCLKKKMESLLEQICLSSLLPTSASQRQCHSIIRTIKGHRKSTHRTIIIISNTQRQREEPLSKTFSME